MVEWKNIDDISTNVFAGGTPNTKYEEYYDGDIPWIRSGEIDFNVILSAERNISKLGFDNSSAKLIRPQSVVMAMTGATVAKTAVVEIATTANQSVCAIETDESKVNYKYLYYWLANNYLKIKSSAQGALTSLNLSKIKQIELPVPHLDVQYHIAVILDTFTSSIENLKEQIALRRKQYEYYRDQLLDLDGKEGVQKLQLSSIASIKVGPFGSLIHKNDYIDGGIPLVNPVQMSNGFILKDESFSVSEEMAKKLSSYTLSTDDIVFARRGEIGRCAIVTERENHYICGTGSLVVRFTEKVNSKFMLYMFNSPRCKSYLLKSAIGGSMLNINCDIVGKMPIIIPSPSIQNKIVNILDKFEASIQNLEAQLAQREKQYEYYRNKLLTFE